MAHEHPWDKETGWLTVYDDGGEWVPMRSSNGHIGWFHRHADGYEGNHVRVVARASGGMGKRAVCKTCGKRPPLGAFRLKQV